MGLYLPIISELDDESEGIVDELPSVGTRLNARDVNALVDILKVLIGQDTVLFKFRFVADHD